MPDMVRSLTAAGKDWLAFAAALLVTVGGALMIGGGVYRVFIRPEWTSGQALDALWPTFLAGFVSLLLGWLADRAES